MTSTDTQIDSLIARGALFVVNHSAGKDSQAMFLKLQARVPAAQLLVIHADLPGVDWPGLQEHIRATIGSTPLIVCRAVKTFLEMVEQRQMWPSPKYRQCTSDLKRGPIEREIRQYLKAHPEFGGLVVNCMGMRAQESTSRAKLEALKLNAKNSAAGREWYDWLPIHDMLVDEVFATIKAAGQEPHAAYAAGMSRLSCCFCIMASKADLTTAARLNPTLYREIVANERRIDQTLAMPVGGERKFLPEITGIEA
jgi:3'-phosphoadenosine 5'-phosphosulfate sulfotransferase (PAPS reductase)/FAD synthetase